MKGFIDNIEELTLSNSNFRKVLWTGTYCQLVVMSLKPGEEIGKEVHGDIDQFFRIDAGEAKVVMDGEEQIVGDGFAFIVPAGVEHNVINSSETDDLKIYTIYSPPNHPDGTVHKDKAEADKYEEEHHHD